MIQTMFRPMLNKKRIWIPAILVICVAAFSSPPLASASCFAQEEEMKVAEQINDLQKMLDSPDIEKQDQAEKDLIAIGTAVLDYLENPGEKSTTQKNERLGRIRKSLEALAIRENTSASKFTLKGKTTMQEALNELKRQTGNKVAFREGLADVYGSTELEVDLEDVSFWQAVDVILEKGTCAIDVYSGTPGTITIVPTNDHPAHANGGAPGGPKIELPEVPRFSEGLFNVSVSSVTCSRNLENPATDYTQLNLRLRWEPRIRPISIDLPCKEMKLIDEFDGKINVSNPESVLSGLVQAEVSEIEFSLPLQLIDRDIAEIKSFECQIDAVLPGRTEVFKFENLGEVDESTSISKSGVVVTYEGFTQNEDLFAINAKFGFEEGAGEVDSHLNWIYDNEVYLENSDGEKFPNFGQNTRSKDETGITIQYLFDFDPSEYTLVYKSPAAIARIPVKVIIKKIPLP